VKENGIMKRYNERKKEKGNEKKERDILEKIVKKSKKEGERDKREMRKGEK
jgi:hypothetical protein